MSSHGTPPTDPDGQRYEAFVRQFVARESRLRAFLRALLPSWEDVDDALQETSIIAWRKFAQFEALKQLRSRARSPLVFSDDVLDLLADEGAEETEQLEAERRALAFCLDQLPSAQRELLERSYQPGARLHEVAAQAGRTAAAFYKVIQRLRAALLDCAQRRLRAEGIS